MSAARSILKDAALLELDPHEIDAEGRLGFYYPDKAEALRFLMVAKGQRTPILISRAKAGSALPWRLHAGLHRLMAARLADLSIFALQTTGTSDELVELEASENLERRIVEPIERAIFVFHTCEAARVRIAREHGDLKQQQLAIRARWDRVRAGTEKAEQALQDEGDHTADNLSAVYGWQDSAAAALEMGPRDIRRSLELYRLVIEPFPALAEKLAHHPVVGTNASQLRLIAQVRDEGQRRQVIEALLEDNELSAELARASVGIDRPAGSAPTAEQKIVSAVVGNLGRLSATVQKRFVDRIVGALKSDEVKRLMRDRLNEELGDAG